jgi:hypothetical protein
LNIEKQLTRRAQVEDAMLIAQKEEHEKAIEKTSRVAQWRMGRLEPNARKIMERYVILESRTNINRSNSKKERALKVQQQEYLKQISIEKAIQHEHDLKGRERQRVEQLEERLVFSKDLRKFAESVFRELYVHLGDTIQRGDDV